MKKVKKLKAKKTVEIIVSGVLASSMLASSCTPYMKDEVYERYDPTNDTGEELLPVSLNLRPEDAQYIMALQRLSQDILRAPAIAKEVAAHPETILMRYGYDGKINLDDSVTKIILALGNDEINRAIQNRDINKFLSLCREYGILSDKIQTDLLSDEFYKEQIAKIQQYAQTRSLNGINDNMEMQIFLVAGALVVAVVGVVVVTGFGLAWNTGVAWNNYVKVNRAMNEHTESMQQDLSAIDIIPMKMIDGYHLISEYYEDIVNAGLDYIKEMYLDILKNYTEDEIRQLLYVNIVRNANK